ncbi:MAG: hypothetical protein MJ097_01970 [Dorea sp.]|nr:hypothetical protein [Dorea sp.]
MCKVMEIIFQLMFGVYFFFLARRDIREKSVSLSSLILAGGISLILALISLIEAGAGDFRWVAGDLVCGGSIGIFFLLISLLSDEKIGYGDSMMICMMGIGLGGWRLICLLQVSSFLLLISVFFLWKRQKLHRETRVAFYPYLFAGYVLTFLDTIIHRIG